MPEYEVDLKTLEDMCSELSETCFLVNKDLKIVWHNESYKHSFHDPKSALSEIFNSESNSGSSLSQVFRTGRIISIVLKNGLKITCIPVRYEDKVASVLCILENTNNSSLVHYFLESIDIPALLFDKYMLYVGHNSLLDKEFVDAPALLEVSLERLRSNPGNLKKDRPNVEKEKNDKTRALKSLIGISHDIELKPLLSGKNIAGYMMLVRRKNSNSAVSNRRVINRNNVRSQNHRKRG